MNFNYKIIIDKLSKKGIVPGLETMVRLLDLLGHPENDLKIVHVAGTNGKGSTIAFLTEILIQSGYRVGRYTSPTIHCYEERFQIDHSYISEEKLEKYYGEIDRICHIMEKNCWNTPTLFEAETAIALMYFRDEDVDYAMIETGMGGLMDATNAIDDPFLTIITSISEDHKAFLGDTIEEIAAQKAGIIKKCAPVVLAANCKEVTKVVEDKCIAVGTSCVKVRKDDLIIIEETPLHTSFSYKNKNYEIFLPGAHQVENAGTAIYAADLLQHMQGGQKISFMSMRHGLKMAQWHGRLELIRKNPCVYLDGAHNPDGASRLADFLGKHFTNKKIIYIMGVLADKDYPKMLSYLMPLSSGAYIFKPNNKRGLEASVLSDAMQKYHIPVVICDNVNQAYEKAIGDHEDADCFVICGSLSFIEEIYQLIEKKDL